MTVKYNIIIENVTAIAVEIFGALPIGILYNMTPGVSVSPDDRKSNDNNVRIILPVSLKL
jgi:hypothetical protein